MRQVANLHGKANMQCMSKLMSEAFRTQCVKADLLAHQAGALLASSTVTRPIDADPSAQNCTGEVAENRHCFVACKVKHNYLQRCLLPP